MILIADSGSTNTTWVLADGEKEVQNLKTGGLNPFFYPDEFIRNELINHLNPQLSEVPQAVYFYGSGCKAEENQKRIKNLFLEIFPDSEITVDHDLTGAARSLAMDQPGIICILGTGSNSCLYDGKNITENKTSLGYVLGDEGSGAVMGMTLVRSFLHHLLPEELDQSFRDTFDLEPFDILKRVYMQPYPNQYLAQFTRFMHQNREHPLIRSMIFSNLESFVGRNVLDYNRADLNANFLGSIAYYFKEELEEILEKLGHPVGTIHQDAISGLLEYHRKVSG